jgi:hypothetical protein
MRTIYAVQTIPLRTIDGDVVGWVRVDPFADGMPGRDQVILRDGSARPQAEAIDRIAADRSLLWPTRDQAVRDGINRLRAADARGG